MLGVLLAAQGLVGTVQYELKLPTDMVWVHVVLATLTWLAMLWAVAAAGGPCAAPPPSMSRPRSPPPRASSKPRSESRPYGIRAHDPDTLARRLGCSRWDPRRRVAQHPRRRRRVRPARDADPLLLARGAPGAGRRRRAGGDRPRAAPTASTSSCSTSRSAPGRTDTRSAGRCAGGATSSRSSCSPRSTPRPTRCSDSRPAPTTTSPSRSGWPSCAAGSAPCCAARAPARWATRCWSSGRSCSTAPSAR